jgi:hypothetical protein
LDFHFIIEKIKLNLQSEKKNPTSFQFICEKMAKFGQKKKTLVRIWNDLSREFRSSAQLCIISAHGPRSQNSPSQFLCRGYSAQEQGVLGVRTCQRWSQGDACLLFPKLPSSNGIIEHKNQYNFYPLIPSKYPPGTCQVS